MISKEEKHKNKSLLQKEKKLEAQHPSAIASKKAYKGMEDLSLYIEK